MNRKSCLVNSLYKLKPKYRAANPLLHISLTKLVCLCYGRAIRVHQIRESTRKLISYCTYMDRITARLTHNKNTR